MRINPLLPVTEPCGGSVSEVPFSLMNNKVLLLLISEPCVRLLCLMSSHSVPLSNSSAADDDTRLAATSLPPVEDKQRNKINYNVNVTLS